MMAFSVSLSNGVCGMKQLKRQMEKIKITPYNEAKTRELQILVNNGSLNVPEEKIMDLLNAGADPNMHYKGLLNAGAELNDNWTLLHYAAFRGYKKVTEIFLKDDTYLNKKNSEDRTPLHSAAYGAQKEVVEMLLNAGADLNIQDNDGDTVLHYAACEGDKEVVESIINFIKDSPQILDNKVIQLESLCSIDKTFRKKCEIFVMNNNKEKNRSLQIPKPLCYKILVQSWDPIQFIIELVNAKNNKGKTALDEAREIGNEEVVKILEPYEKK